jgi:demethylmenaquinone methyltransferase/2-methoxy-6-polyprenyl-1,4-benzoquinol methylase
MFGAIAPKYDLMNHLLSMNVDRYWRWRTVRRVRPSGTAPILDLCTGTGDLALAYRRAAAAGTPVVGADFCHEMLVVGAQKSQQADDGSVRFLEADAQALPLPDEAFQIVSVAFGLRNVADTDRGLAEMTRVCRPGGRVAVLEFSQPTWLPMRLVYGFYFRHVLPRVGELLSPNRDEAYRYLPASVGEFPCGEALVERMRGAGLVDVTFTPLTFGVATLYVGTKPSAASKTGER